MNGLLSVTLLLILFMIYFLGHWHYTDIQDRRDWEAQADHERAQIKAIAEQAVRENAAQERILQQFPTVDRHLRTVRDKRR